MKGLLKKSLTLVSLFALAMFGAAYALAGPLSFLFVGYDSNLFQLTVGAFYIFSFSFLFCGFPIFGSAFFTALNNGLVSAGISFLRTLAFQAAAVLAFPLLWGVDGIWASTAAAEALAMGVAILCLWKMRGKYGY